MTRQGREGPHAPHPQATRHPGRDTPIDHPQAENLRQRLLDPERDADRLFPFLRVHRMPPTNNVAERSLRHPVIFRKIIFGNRSDLGAHALAVNLSVLPTA